MEGMLVVPARKKGRNMKAGIKNGVRQWLVAKTGVSSAEIDSKLTYERKDIRNAKSYQAFLMAVDAAVTAFEEAAACIPNEAARDILCEAISGLPATIRGVVESDTFQNEAVKRLSGLKFPDITSKEYKDFVKTLPKESGEETEVSENGMDF